MSVPYKKLKKPLEYYTVLCRGCLADTGEMKNMHEFGLVDDFMLFTDIQLSPTSTAELLCTTCEQQLGNCQKFRRQCLMSDRVIREAAKMNKPAETNDLAVQDIQENVVSHVMIDGRVIFMIIAPDTASKIYLPCMYCTEKYIKQKDLLMHLGKSHHIDTNNYDIELQYYCNINSCSHSLNSDAKKYFTGRKNLNQHFIKVHKSKVLNCCECQKTFSTVSELDRHLKTCNLNYICQLCNITYTSNERLMVHLLRKHPDLHRQYKEQKHMKRKSETVTTKSKRYKDGINILQESYPFIAECSSLAKDTETDSLSIGNNLLSIGNNLLSAEVLKPQKSDLEKFAEYICDSPKRSSATQTKLETNIRNDVTLPSWQNKNDEISTSTQTDIFSTSTQTDIFEDLLSLKSQNSEDESSIFFSETVSLSDIQTQTFPLEFGLSRSNKQTLTSETQSPDLSIKETQTCVCLSSPNIYNRYSESISSSPLSNLTSTETQTGDFRNVKDVLLSFNSAETQTSFEESREKIL